MTQHLPRRPGWECLACGKDWPCDPAREELAQDTGGGTALSVLMWAHLEDYVVEASPEKLPDAFERFLSWTYYL